jgi:hypothetical protein
MTFLAVQHFVPKTTFLFSKGYWTVQGTNHIALSLDLKIPLETSFVA